MYVQKFEAESIDEALKNIKRELGPDAIILKTVTNKGLKGAFKKARVEVTAAISERSYTKKVRVDAVLDDNQKESFYAGSASHISNMIDVHNKHESDTSVYTVKNEGYGSVALNKSAKSVKKIGQKIINGLDDFLSTGAGDMIGDEIEEDAIPSRINHLPRQQAVEHPSFDDFTQKTTTPVQNTGNSDSYKELYQLQKEKIESLEKRLFQLVQEVEKLERKEPRGIYQLRTTLKSFDISEKYITDVCKKALFELSDEEVENAEVVFEFALREMIEVVKTELPLFSSIENDLPVVSVLISENSSGQSSMIKKIASLKSDSVVISCNANEQPMAASSLAEKMYGFNIKYAGTIAEIISETRKALENGKSVFIDYKNPGKEINETKKFVDGLRRSFDKVEVLISLSAIHSEIYNRKVANRYRSISDGIVISNLDLCLNFGALFNIAEEVYDLPFKFYSNGEVIPDDIETATPERILAGIFQFE